MLAETEPPAGMAGTDTSGWFQYAAADVGLQLTPSVQVLLPPCDVVVETSPEYVQSSLRRKLALVTTPRPPAPIAGTDCTFSWRT